MDFFASQDRARASSRRLIVLYALALLGVVISLNIMAAIAYGASGSNVADGLGVYVATTLGTLVLVALATLFKQSQIGGDGAKVAELLGGRAIVDAPADLDERKFVNVVQEMSLASGVPVPRLYVMDQEQAINAFAAGNRPEAAVIGVTRGTLRRLNRDELQGVVAHEFSHILNGDMRLNLRLIALNFGIMAIGYLGLQIVRFAPRSTSRSSNRKGGDGAAAIVVVGIAMAIVGYVGTLFGKMLQAAVSRQREYLADASAVQFTRNPSGIANALRKIGGLSDRPGEGGVLATPNAGEAAHLFFADGVVGFLDSVFATHPPLEKRIRAIEPNFNGQMIAETVTTGAKPTASTEAIGFAGGRPPPLPSAGQRLAVRPADLRPAPTIVEPRELAFAVATLDALPASLLDAARDPYSARPLALSLLLDDDAPMRDAQLRLIGDVDATMARLAATLWPTVRAAGPAARLPLLDLALPALHQLSRTQLRQFRLLCHTCAAADRQLSPFELALSQILEHQLWSPREAGRPIVKYKSVAGVSEQARVVLSTLANAGGPEQADAAYAAGVARLGSRSAAVGLPSRLAHHDARALAHALDDLDAASPAVRQRLVDAAAHCVAHDGVARVEEVELMRGICAAFSVPIPPFLVPA